MMFLSSNSNTNQYSTCYKLQVLLTFFFDKT
jgi:hypothetical protein